MNRVKVLFGSSDGVMYFDGRKPVFQHRGAENEVKVGLGVCVEGTYVDKGTVGFVDLENVIGVVPKSYFTIDFFANGGTPLKVWRGTFGDSTFVKEEYLNKITIRTFNEDGEVLVFENSHFGNKKLNMYFSRLNLAIEDWEDITAELNQALIEDIRGKESRVNLGNPFVLMSLRKLARNKIVKTENGVILAKGNHDETLVIWGNGNKASLAWLGSLYPGVDEMEDVSEKVRGLLLETGIN